MNTQISQNYRERVSTAYAYTQSKTAEWFRTIVSFGALLDEVASFLGEGRGRGNDGKGLRGWLEENCPEVNYNTARGYRAMAAKCVKMLGGGSQAIAALQGREMVTSPGSNDVVEVDAEILEKRDALFEAADSRRKLEQMYLDFMGGAVKRGRPVGTKAAKVSAAELSPEQSARALWSKVLEPANTYGLEPASRLLTLNDARTALDVLTTLCDILKRRLNTRD